MSGNCEDGLDHGGVFRPLFTKLGGSYCRGYRARQVGLYDPRTDTKNLVEAFGHEDALNSGKVFFRWMSSNGFGGEWLGNLGELFGG